MKESQAKQGLFDSSESAVIVSNRKQASPRLLQAVLKV